MGIRETIFRAGEWPGARKGRRPFFPEFRTFHSLARPNLHPPDGRSIPLTHHFLGSKEDDLSS
jgi:hypothetical protein